MVLVDMHAMLTALTDASETSGVKMVMLKTPCTAMAGYTTPPLSQHSVPRAELGRKMLPVNLLQTTPQSKLSGTVLNNVL